MAISPLALRKATKVIAAIRNSHKVAISSRFSFKASGTSSTARAAGPKMNSSNQLKVPSNKVVLALLRWITSSMAINTKAASASPINSPCNHMPLSLPEISSRSGGDD